MTEQKRLIVPDENGKIIQIEIDRLTTFKDHPFRVQRRYAAEKLGYRKVTVIIRVKCDEEFVIAIVDVNLQRERISFSEKGFAYKMKNDIMKRVRGRKKRGQVDDNLLGKRTIEIIAEERGESYKQIQRYIKVTALYPKLLEMLDHGEISFNPVVEISN